MMAKHIATTTQGEHPWRAVIRTVFAALLALAGMAPLVYVAVTQGSPEAATGAAATALLIAGAITRVMALPVVEDFLARFLPWLAAAPRGEATPEPVKYSPIPGTTLDGLPRGSDGSAFGEPFDRRE